MVIEERTVGDVVVLDIKGRVQLGEGDEMLKDKVNSLLNQGQKKIVLNLAEVPYIDSAGLGEIVRTYTTVSRQGGDAKKRCRDQRDSRKCTGCSAGRESGATSRGVLGRSGAEKLRRHRLGPFCATGTASRLPHWTQRRSRAGPASLRPAAMLAQSPTLTTRYWVDL